MTEPRRLLNGEGTEFERCLLRAGEAEEVPPDVSMRMAEVLGLGAGSLPNHAPPAGGATDAGAPGAHPAGAGLLKVGAVLAVVGGVVAGFVLWGGDSGGDDSGSDVRQVIPQASPAAENPPSDEESAQRGEPLERERKMPVLEPTDLAPASPGEGSTASAALKPGPSSASLRERSQTSSPLDRRSAGDVAAEVKLLDRARKAVAAGDDRRANHLLSQYAARFPKGVLRHEARVLRQAIDARSAN